MIEQIRVDLEAAIERMNSAKTLAEKNDAVAEAIRQLEIAKAKLEGMLAGLHAHPQVAENLGVRRSYCS